jgi:2-oxoglutarate dehydrogenase complex dehydrogenase (E1) component-like enzyme
MVQTPEQKKRLRYRKALLKNQEPPTRTKASRALLEKVRAELQQEVAPRREAVQEASAEFQARAVNQAIREEMRAELLQEMATKLLREVEEHKARKRLREVEQAACQSIRDAAEHEIKKVKQAAAAVSVVKL